ncbi:MAG: ATP-binding protein [Planctomycetota bacterium]|nr:ATP-binding protein [Planctomycetota bacterium]
MKKEDVNNLRKRFEELCEISISPKGGTSEVLSRLLEKVAAILHGKFLFVRCKQGGTFALKAGYNLPEELKTTGGQSVADAIDEKVIVSGKPVVIENLQEFAPLSNSPYIKKYRLKSYLCVPLISHDGKVIGTLCLVDDKSRKFTEEDIRLLNVLAQRISMEMEREELLNRLKESQERYYSFFEKASDGILVIEFLEGGLLEANHRFQKLSGYTKEQIVDMRIDDLRPDKEAEAFDRFRKGLMKGEEEFNGIPIRTANGGIFFADIRVSKLEVGGRYLLHCLFRDVTEKKSVLERMIRSERLASLGELAAAVAHEINNPMLTILAYSHLLLEKLGADEKLREWLQMMVGEANRVKKIVQGLLEFARRKEPELSEVNVNDIVESVVRLVENQAKICKVNINLQISPDIPLITADASQLQQVFLNVAINAIEAMEKGGVLTITTKPFKEQWVKIGFSDTGCGIPKENLSKVFDPFFSTKPRGTGLGLAVSHGIIMSHKGEINIESEVNKGTTVTITLPLKKE